MLIFGVAAVAWHSAFWIPFALTVGAAVLFTVFFRDPERDAADGIVSPADGIIQSIDEQDGVTQIVTFMNVLDVHVNRAPLDGRVVCMEHIRGGYVPAYKKDAYANQRLVWDFETEIGRLRVVQITGALARRIVPYVQQGDLVKKGDRIGMIRLGSRVDVYVPGRYPVAVSVGQRVHAGRTTLVRLDT